jgi:uncharacterized membrane protein (UPF0182 family)
VALPYERESAPQFPTKTVIVVLIVLALLVGARSIASLVIEYQWWKELGQLATWERVILYNIVPQVLAAIAVFAVLWVAHARALKFAGTGLREHPVYARASTVLLLALAALIAFAAIDGWTLVSYYGSKQSGSADNAWRDPIFNNPLTFYLFDLPFYSQLLVLVLVTTFFAAIIFWLAARGWQIRRQMPRWADGPVAIDFRDLRFAGGLEPVLLRTLIAVFLLGLAIQAFLGRYRYLGEDHGFMVGVDWLSHNVQLPLQWVAVLGFIAAAGLVLTGRWKLALAAVALVFLRNLIPPVVSAAYVKPNELSLQRPYIEHHIAGTRAAYGLRNRMKEAQYPAQLEADIDPKKNQALIENVRLWDWRAFHDIVTQIQALRQYYVFPDTDVDRYVLDGHLRQVLLTPRELDIGQLPEARANWINTHFIYTHGYGLVMAEANTITPNGQPVLFIKDAPPVVQTSSLKLTRPELYFGESTHEPVFVSTEQPEFNYPAGDDNIQTNYVGKGGIPIYPFLLRLAAAVHHTDRNLLLTGYLTPKSRMLIRRNIKDRVRALAGFLSWDPDPYLVVTADGRLVWTIDGYTSSASHPYSRLIRFGDAGIVNYIRNSVKATVDAYDGTVTFYVFEPQDPLIRAFQAIFPELFRPASEMPADLRAHTRYPELLFRGQAEIYRTFHMQDPEAFYNREDLWDLARNIYGQATEPEILQPTYLIATLPGGTEPEFLLVQPFTPRNKDNLIGLMVARCDGENLGDLVVLQLSKQSLIYGPLQIEARITSDQNIAKDLALWNQQGSQVIRGQMLVLPVDKTIVYVEPIYIQAAQARMPQLRKVVVAMGNRLVYRDTYAEAIAELTGGKPLPPGISPRQETVISQAAPQPGTSAAAAPAGASPDSGVLDAARNHLRRYRDLSAEGRWSEAGRELEALEKLLAR